MASSTSFAFVLALLAAASPFVAGHGGDNHGHHEDGGCKTVADQVVGTPELSTLLAALQAVNLTGTLDDEDLVATVFAPTNAAFASLLSALNLTAQELLANTDLVQAVLSYHVVPGVAANSADLMDGQILPTLLGTSSLTVDLSAGDVVINSETGGMANVTSADIPACDAVVHVIDSVLVPDTDALQAQGA